MATLTTTGVQTEAHLPFAGLHQMLRPVRARAARLPSAQRAALDAAFGLTDEVAPEHYRIAMTALDLVSEVAADAPLLLVAEDAQWLDRPSSEVLAFVARRIESDPIVLLAATRDGYRSLLDDAGLPELRLGGLGGGAAGALLDACAPQLSLAARSPSRAWGHTCCSPRAQRIPTALRIGRRRPLQSARSGSLLRWARFASRCERRSLR
jgi:hypothetical protein